MACSHNAACPGAAAQSFPRRTWRSGACLRGPREVRGACAEFRCRQRLGRPKAVHLSAMACKNGLTLAGCWRNLSTMDLTSKWPDQSCDRCPARLVGCPAARRTPAARHCPGTGLARTGMATRRFPATWPPKRGCRRRGCPAPG